MKKIVIDSDGLIKLNKAGVLVKFLSLYKCLIPEEVYKEAVLKGKRELYEDAFELEKILKNMNVEILRAEFNEKAESIIKGVTGLGNGEKAVLHLFFNNENAIILSDDRRFINLLEKNRIPFITPGNVLLHLVERGNISKAEGLESLERLRPYIRGVIYEKIKSILLGGKYE